MHDVSALGAAYAGKMLEYSPICGKTFSDKVLLVHGAADLTAPLTSGADAVAAVHAAAAAYFSDYALLTTAMLPHGVQIGSPRMGAVASLDHSLWFHTADFRADEWLLYDMESPWAACGRGLAFGHLYTQQGKLAISCAQEGVMRLAKPSVKRSVSTAARWFADLVMQANKRWGS